MAALVLLRYIVHDHDNLFVTAEAVHSIGIFVLIYKLMKEKTCADVAAEFSYYKLALQWPNSVCNQGNQCVKNTFSIHGLWPFWANDSIVQPCPGLELTSSQVTGIETSLKQYWPSLYSLDDFNFWSHEWARHGRCLGLEPSVYFKDAIDLRKCFFKDDDLFQKGFGPSPNPYKLITLYNTLGQANGAYGELKCNMRNGVYQLVEVRICIDRQKNLRDCPKRFTTCGNDDQALVLFPNSSTIVPGPLQGVSAQKRNGWAGPRPSWTNYWTSSFPLLVVFLYVI